MKYVIKPFKRTVRMFTNGSYSKDGNWQYLLHKDFANEPRHYIRAYLLIQDDLIKLFEYVEPCDENLKTISLKIQELLTRTCIEIEANFTAILKENIYTKKGNWNLENDYCLIDFSHKLSSYEVNFPLWKGYKNNRLPFENWKNKKSNNWHCLSWYQAYNKSKHDRHNHFDKATFDNLLDAISGLIVLLTSQFLDEEYSTTSKGLSIGGGYSYDYNPSYDSTIGDFFRIKLPTNWLADDCYNFTWSELEKESDPIQRFNYDKIKLRK